MKAARENRCFFPVSPRFSPRSKVAMFLTSPRRVGAVTDRCLKRPKLPPYTESRPRRTSRHGSVACRHKPSAQLNETRVGNAEPTGVRHGTGKFTPAGHSWVLRGFTVLEARRPRSGVYGRGFPYRENSCVSMRIILNWRNRRITTSRSGGFESVSSWTRQSFVGEPLWSSLIPSFYRHDTTRNSSERAT